MGLISDESGRPMQQDQEKTEEKPSGNGQNHGVETKDARSLPSSMILYNFVRVTMETVGLEGIVHQMMQAKEAQKMIVDPPQLERAKKMYDEMYQRLRVLAREIDERFKDIDEARFALLGIEVYTPPAEPSPAASEEPAPTTTESEGGEVL